MTRICIALAAVTAGALLAPAHAVPPTATPSPGYDARLQESRRGSATQRDAWCISSVIASRMSAFGLRTAWLRIAHATSPK